MATFTNIAATTAAVANRYVTIVGMSNVAYTLANTTPVWQGAGFVTVLHATVAGTDTIGIITVVGKDLTGQTRTEVITPGADTTTTGVVPFRTITSITGSGWTAVSTADNITIGVAAGCIPCGTQGTLVGVVLNNSVAATIVVSDSGRTIATIPASQAAGTFYPYNVDFGGYLKVATTSTNDITVIHSSTLPSSMAL